MTKKKKPSKAELHTMTFEQLRDRIIKLFQSAHYSKSVHELFAVWAEVSALTVHQMPYHAMLLPKDDDFRAIEEQYMTAIKGLDREILDLICEVYSWVEFGLIRFERDILGPVYMGLEIGSKRGGQYFTPEGVCDMMAQLTFDPGIFDAITDRPVTFHEPASGSGGMLISLIRTIKESGIDHRARAWFDAIDLSRNSFNMTYIQLGLLGTNGVIHHANTLSLEEFDHRLLPQSLVFRYQASEEGQATMNQVRAMRGALELLSQPLDTDSTEGTPSEDLVSADNPESPPPPNPPTTQAPPVADVVLPPPKIPTGADFAGIDPEDWVEF